MTNERLKHIEIDHLEMSYQIAKIYETLQFPDIIIRSNTDYEVELFYRHYKSTPLTEKYMCVAVKAKQNDPFILTAYFTDKIKRGAILWQKK
ncbi:MAG: hypothetical protein QG641_2650 [Candidatus Poribacteria bacterium]|nr:hypothetical protein [Candidatus Poribacteria bacterium]